MYVAGAMHGVLIKGDVLIYGCPYRGVPLYIHIPRLISPWKWGTSSAKLSGRATSYYREEKANF